MALVTHHSVAVDGIKTFYREAGPADAPVLLLPHGYPSSSFQFRNLMPALGDQWRLVAPDLPGFGYTRAEKFEYTFDAYAQFLHQFVDELGLSRYAIYLQDYGSQFGLRLAMSAPDRVAALIIQNGDIYDDQHGPKYAPLKEMWADPNPAALAKIAESVSEEGFRAEFLGEVPDTIADRISPDLWTLSWAQVGTPPGPQNLVRLLADQRNTVAWFPRQQAYLREHQPPTLIVWGPHDGYMPAGAARAYLRDLPAAELHLLDGGHWLLETNLDEVVVLIRDFLARVHPPT
jgi:pimeloyl-ACP methyl ester carboxylesterase